MAESATLAAQPANYLNWKKGIASWIFSTDHKRIGMLYLMAIVSFFFVGVTLGFFMRIEQMTMGKTLMSAQTYNALFTLHGVIMIFLFIIPGIPAILGNFFLPILIGARDVAFPRLNLLSWWVYMAGAVLAVTALFTGGGPPDTGWTFYAPYSIRTGTNVTLAVFAAFVLGFSSILTGLNFITTIHRLRAPGMTWFRMPLFVWAHYATAWIQLLATPILGITLLLVIMERIFNLGLFDPSRGGDPVLYQHLFWIYSHPAVYIMILPAMGVITEILPTAAKKPAFGYKAIAFSSLTIAFVGYLVWAHHMFVSGISDTAAWIFSLLTFLVAIPSAIKVFNWTATLYKGSITFSPPLLYALTFIFLFSIGGLTGLVQGALLTDVHVHDTYFVVGHFHYVMFGGTAFGLLAGLLYWFPKMTGRMYSFKRSYVAWFFLFLGFNTLYFTMLVLGWEGMPRRYYDHVPEFHSGHVIATVGSWILILGLVLYAWNLFRSLKRGEPAPANPWGGVTLEWTIPSPPPHENFEEIPTITGGPYEFPTGEPA
ncbi:MAG TPA: cbb3-type cytochrome c oxidase subunit I [Thermoanaerobaculia bacterium]|nr:cbb3-type cytochrome c oxidase subunit I [Thermoanaerobaculia bacterium]HUM30102.1 cbb3-type cytochrome c oxidase subunit I [Thermoanaerobaculia bacterium]HXK68799.1 cbb3-type cytochrome c oxidase subunit I [Thermoanaerobaculia bacterium]